MANVSVFGTTAAGAEVQKITITKGDLTACILTRGAILQSVRLAGVPYWLPFTEIP